MCSLQLIHLTSDANVKNNEHSTSNCWKNGACVFNFKSNVRVHMYLNLCSYSLLSIVKLGEGLHNPCSHII